MRAADERVAYICISRGGSQTTDRENTTLRNTHRTHRCLARSAARRSIAHAKSEGSCARGPTSLAKMRTRADNARVQCIYACANVITLPIYALAGEEIGFFFCSFFSSSDDAPPSECIISFLSFRGALVLCAMQLRNVERDMFLECIGGCMSETFFEKLRP